MTYQLPTFKMNVKQKNAYTVDTALKQFRRIRPQGKHFAGMEYIDFDSEKGEMLLSRYIKTLDNNTEEFNRIAQAIV